MKFLKSKQWIAVFLILLIPGLLISGCATEEEVTAEPIVLGVPGSYGYPTPNSALKAVKLAAEEINERGGVLVGDEYRPLKVVSIDTRDLEPGIPLHDALAAVEKLLEEEKPHALLVGPTRSEVLFAAMDIIAEKKIPHIISIPFSPVFEQKLTEDYEKYKYFFRTCNNAFDIAGINAEAGIYVAEKLGLEKKVFIVYQDTMALEAAAAGIKMFYERAGFEAVGFDGYPLGATDFSTSLEKARREGATIVHPLADMPELGVLVKQARDIQLEAMVVGYVTPVGFEEAWDVYEGQIDGMIQCVLQMGNIPVKAYPKSVDFYNNYGKLWGESARKQIDSHGPAPSYDAVYILAAAIERAGTLDGDAVVEALKETDMVGVIGRIRFNELHQAIYGKNFNETAMGIVFQWQKPGVRVPIYPENIAEGEIQLPPYMQ
jgi:branched-chain amino acid transport system substrate-binding protein